jgi:hypothetical protein
MTRATWKNNDIHIVLQHPQITPFNGNWAVESIKDVMNIVYTLVLFNDGRKMFEINTKDFPKLQIYRARKPTVLIVGW